MARAQPTFTDVRALVAAGKRDEAWAALSQLLKRDPGSPTLNLFAAQLAASAEEHERAIAHARIVLGLDPKDRGALRLLGESLMKQGRMADAIEALAQLMQSDPSDPGAARQLANAQLAADRMEDAERTLDAALQRRPDHAPLWHERAQLFLATGRAKEAASLLERAVIAHPRDAAAAQFLASTLNYVPDADPHHTRRTHDRAATLFEKSTSTPSFDNSRDPERPLRIGYISPDLHAHSVSYFLLPLLEAHDRSRIDAHLFWTGKKEDAFTHRYRAAGVWHACAALSDVELCRLIRRAGIDVLVELSGHTTGNAMGLMALQPAPVQVSAIGYPHSTGLRSINARLGDSVTDPPDQSADRILRVDPCFLCYQPPSDQDEPEPVAIDTARPPTFGSFNALSKCHPGVLDLWARVVIETPGSRLMLKGDLRLGAVGRRLMQALADRGVNSDRVTLHSHRPTPAEGRRMYEHVDVALDTFPYNGTTTTCESLWMGVPVVTMLGRSHAGRVSASLLSAIGLGDLVAKDQDDYVRLARDLALDRARLGALRTALRHRMRHSPLCDAVAYARRFERGIRELWRSWCSSATAP